MTEQAVFMNMCRVISPDGKWLMQERSDKNYPGILFPGGHLEKNETFQQSVIREVREETGLTLIRPRLRGIRHWTAAENNIHYVILMYEAVQFEGELTPSTEGKVFWASPEELKNMHTTSDFQDNLDVLDNPELQECCYLTKENQIVKVLE